MKNRGKKRRRKEDGKREKRSEKKVISFFLFLLFFLILGFIFLFSSLDKSCLPFFSFFSKIETFLFYFNLLGTFYFLLPFSLIFLVRNKKLFFKATISLILTAIFVFLFKLLVTRPRPYQLLALSLNFPPSSSSFPSGHASLLSSFLFFARKINILFIIFSILTLLILLSRFFLCFHYPSDLFFGFVLGSIISFVVNLGVEAFWRKFRKQSRK